jgi:2-methylcitrate dehydratase PrpD
MGGPDRPPEQTDPDTQRVLDRVAAFTLRLDPEAFPAGTRQRAALLLLDTLGICAAAAPLEAGRIARDTAVALFGAGADGPAARLLFDGRRVSLAGAVFAAATQIDNLDGHDGYNPTKGHIGVVAAPTLAALARPGLSGAEALAALIVGYEIAGRAGIALHATVPEYHTSGSWNALGVVAMVARLRGQTDAQLREGLGIAEYHGPRSQMMREIATPTMLHDGSGWGALAGMAAALMAERGFTGAPAVTVERVDAAAVWADLGQVWQTDLQYIKPYPVCRWAHAPIDAVREIWTLRGGRAPRGDAETITGVHIRSFANAVALYPAMPATTAQAQYSLAFAVAAQIEHGVLGVEQITGAGLEDARVARLVARTTTEIAPEYDARYPAGRWADVTLTMADGRVLTSGETHARGGPERPFTQADIVDKFHAFADPVLGRPRATALRDAVLALARGGGFDAVARHLHDPICR